MKRKKFLHGPVYEIKKDNAVFLLDMDDTMHDRVMMIYEGLHQLTDRVYLITRHPGNSDKRVMTIDVDACSLLLPMLFVMPFQILSSRICDDCRINAITVYNYRFPRRSKLRLTNAGRHPSLSFQKPQPGFFFFVLSRDNSINVLKFD